MTAPEFAMWKLLRIQAHGAWLPQYPVNIDGAWVILDFYLKHARLAVEIDGPEHNRESDARRDARLLAVHGIRTVRFTNQQALGETWSCICSLCRAVNGK
jgi:very-short-patch-repair endonuclease